MEIASLVLLAIPAVFLAILLSNAVSLVAENERLVVFRLGRYSHVAGPGLVLTVPFIDRGVRVFLPKRVPEWQSISEDLLRDTVKQIVLNEEDPERLRGA